MNRNYPDTIDLNIIDPFMGGTHILTVKISNSNNCFILKIKDQELAIHTQDIKAIFDLLMLYIKSGM